MLDTGELVKKDTTRRSHTLNVPFTEIRMGRSLDRGAFGEVYHGFWRDNEVAVKVSTYPGVWIPFEEEGGQNGVERGKGAIL